MSPRTVSLYFPLKLDLALSYIADSARRLSAACAGRGPGQSTLDVLNGWLRKTRTRSTPRPSPRCGRCSRPTPHCGVLEPPEIAESRKQVALDLAADLGRAADDPVVLLINGALAGIIAALVQIDPRNIRWYSVVGCRRSDDGRGARDGAGLAPEPSGHPAVPPGDLRPARVSRELRRGRRQVFAHLGEIDQSRDGSGLGGGAHPAV